MFKNITIKQKLMGITAFLVVSSMMMTYLVFSSLKTIQSEFYTLKDPNAKAEILTIEVARDLNLISRLTRDIMLGNYFVKGMERFEKTSTEITKNFEEIEKLSPPN